MTGVLFILGAFGVGSLCGLLLPPQNAIKPYRPGPKTLRMLGGEWVTEERGAYGETVWRRGRPQ